MNRWLLLLTLLPLLACGQPEADGFSATLVPDSVFLRMQGKSFPADCIVPRTDLRYLRLLHVDAEGQTRMGEMVCNRQIAQDLLDIFRELYRQRYPIERIRLIDDYDADDERSMRDNNTSCFCYRTIAGSRKLSKHAQGLAVDVNTLYNPYVRRRADGTLLVQPSTGRSYADRSKPSPYRITAGDLLVRLFRQHGFRWGGDWRSYKDYQHFDK